MESNQRRINYFRLHFRQNTDWAQFNQSIVDAAISQWRRRLSVCVRVRRAHYDRKF